MDTLKNPTKCLWRWEPDSRSNFFFCPPAHQCAVTYITEMSLHVTLPLTSTWPLQHIWPQGRIQDITESSSKSFCCDSLIFYPPLCGGWGGGRGGGCHLCHFSVTQQRRGFCWNVAKCSNVIINGLQCPLQGQNMQKTTTVLSIIVITLLCLFCDFWKTSACSNDLASCKWYKETNS